MIVFGPNLLTPQQQEELKMRMIEWRKKNQDALGRWVDWYTGKKI